MLEAISDSIVKWEVFSNEKLCENFPLEEWKLMAYDIETDVEWKEFLDDYKDFIKCYVLYTCIDNQAIAFMYIYNEDGAFNTVSIHGGGWSKSVKHSFLYYHGYILMIENLFSKKIKVRTQCFLYNKKAIRFSRSVGFVPYRYSDTTVYMWINQKRLQNSKIYRYFRRNEF